MCSDPLTLYLGAVLVPVLCVGPFLDLLLLSVFCTLTSDVTCTLEVVA
jgi:hypothetical protein